MDVKLPRLGEGADSGTVASVFVHVGDKVNKDQPVLELESDKAVASIPSPAAGTVTKLHVKEGDQIKVGQLIVTLDEGKGPEPIVSHKREEIEEPEISVAPSGDLVGMGKEDSAPLAGVLPSPSTLPPAASPTIRKMARELGIDLSRVRGSERGGRIVVKDLRAYVMLLQEIAGRVQRGTSTAAEVSETASRERTAVPQAVDFSKWGPVHTEKLSTLRRTISTRMVDSWTAVPHVTQFDQADITDLVKLQKKHAAAYERKKARLTLTPLLLKALVRTLVKHPKFNSSLDELNGLLVYKDYYHIGIAVDTEQGLIVPVLRDVDKKSLLDLALQLQDLAVRTRERKVGLNEMAGGTFTVSNQGGIGSGHFTPIINKPEVAILGVARATEQMVLKKAKFVGRSVLPVSLSYDHRVIDGADAARFMVDFVLAIEGMSEKDLKL
ncbi:MAG: 2-oxo acid dehydrogenase subunit E2 [Bacteroidota bacterium]